MKFEICFPFLISVWITGVSANTICYDELGCFNTSYPWSSLLRPFPDPVTPKDVNTTFFFVDRNDKVKNYFQTWPQIKIDSRFDGKKPTVIITHGFNSDTDAIWVKNMTNAFLNQEDVNVFLVDWKKGASYNYFQAASNARIAAAEIIRLIRNLIATRSINVSQFYLMGHSLGAHAMSYVGKNITGIGRITALDPAQPGFQGKSSVVRLDKEDAKFIDVIHTNGRPFLGLGMSDSVGSVDFFMNGGDDQPDCLLDGKKYNISSISKIANLTIDVLYNLAACSHLRSTRYMAVSINNSCIFVGHLFNATYADHRYQNFILNETCSLETCSIMGLYTPKFPARGNFAVKTSGEFPYCIEDERTSKTIENMENYFVTVDNTTFNTKMDNTTIDKSSENSNSIWDKIKNIFHRTKN